jgi:predicted  nucleic acid-binding Zn-ribbon protein
MDTDRHILEGIDELKSAVERIEKDLSKLQEGVFARLESIGKELAELAATIHAGL